MALKFILDENLRGPLWRAIRHYNLDADFSLDVRLVGDHDDIPLGISDPDLLNWCESEDRILVSFDRSTLAIHLAAHLALGRHLPGIFIVRMKASIPSVIEAMALVAHFTEASAWRDRIEYLG